MADIAAEPGELRAAAAQLAGVDAALATLQEHTKAAYDSFQGRKEFGSLEAQGLLDDVRNWIGLNGDEGTFLTTVAQVFEAADERLAGSVPTGDEIEAALRAAGLWARTDIDVGVHVPYVNGLPKTSGYADDPVNVATGNFVEVEVDLGFGPLLGWLQLRRTYNSRDRFRGAFGPGWSSWADTRLVASPSGRLASLRGPDGQVAAIAVDGAVGGNGNGNGDGEVPGEGGRVERDPDGGGLVMRFPSEGLTWRFDDVGRPVEIDPGPGAKVTLSWDDERLVGLVHERGRSLRLDWDPDATRVVGAVTDDGRRVVYGYDGRGRLVTVDGLVGLRRYEWDGRDRIVAVIDADGVVAARNRYDTEDRVVSQVTPFGRTVRFWYRPGLVTEVDDDQGGPRNVWHHDQQGRLTRVVDGDGCAVTTVWGRGSSPLAVTDRRGATTRHRHDGQDRLVRTDRPDGTWTTHEWDSRHRLVRTSGPGDVHLLYGYTGPHRQPTSITDPDGRTTRVELDVTGLVTRVTDPDGVGITFTHTGDGQVATATDGHGRTWAYDWDPAGQLVSRTSPLGHTTRYERDRSGQLTAVVTPDGAVRRTERSPAGRVVATVEPDGHRHRTRHGDHGEPVETVDPLGATTTHTWDAYGSRVGTVEPDGATWVFRHDALRRVVAVTDPVGATWRAEHDAEGAVVATVTPTGTRREIDVDAAGVLQGAGVGSARVGFGYDDRGRMVARVDAGGTTARAERDRCGRISSVTEPGGGVTRFGYTPAGRLARVVGPTGAVTRYHYDQTGRLRTVVDPCGGRTRFGYEPDGRVSSVTAPSGDRTRTRYDACGRVTAVTAPNGGTSSYAYDACGRVTAVTDPLGAVTGYGYDAAGRVAVVVDRNGGETRFAHDPVGRLVATTDPSGARCAYGYDLAGRVVSETDPLGRTTSYSYDADGRLVGRLDPDGTRHDRCRDVTGQPAAPSADGAVAMARRWDADGNLVSETTPAAAQRWSYDAAGNVVAHTLELADHDPVTVGYELDACGRPVAVDDPVLGRVRIDRDPAGRPLRVRGAGLDEVHEWRHGQLVAWSRSTPHGAVSVGYRRDPAGRIVDERHGDGREVRYGYDPAGQLTEVRHSRPGAGPEAGAGPDTAMWSYRWDVVGRLVQEAGPGGERRLAYDSAGQLTGVTGPAGPTTYAWDPCGRRTTETGPQHTRRYGWDAPTGRLLSVEDTWAGAAVAGAAGGGEGPSARTRRFGYDPLGRLAAVDDVDVLWDPTDRLERLVAVGSHRLGGLRQADALVDPLGGPGWLSIRDERGGPAGLGPWGEREGGDPPGPDIDLGAGRGVGLGHRGELSVDGLTWLRARAYDPATRGFLTPDPLPGPAGHPWGANTYHYAANDPVNHADPLGLRPLDDDALRAIRDAWTSNWWDRNGGYVVGGLMIAGGVLLMATGVGGIAGGILIGAAFAGGLSAVSQQAFTGSVDWKRFAVDTVVGAASGGLGAWAAGIRTTTNLGRFGTQVGVDTAADTAGGMTTRALRGGDPFDPTGLAVDVLAGGAGGAGAAGATWRAGAGPRGTQVNTLFPTPAQLDQFAPGAAFAGAFDPRTGNYVTMPSGSTRLVSGAEPLDLVVRQGGHVPANELLAANLGQPPFMATVRPGFEVRTATENLGFTVLSRNDGSFELQYYSHGINEMNPSFPGVHVPWNMRAQIADSVRNTTGRSVVYSLYGR